MQLAALTRLAAIERSGILLTARYSALSGICEAVATDLGVNSAQVNVITATQQIFVAEWPKPRKRREPGPLSDSGCREVVLAEHTVIIPDTALHPVVSGQPWTLEWRGYLGAPVRFSNQILGSLCVLTKEPRAWSETNVDTLEQYADKVSGLF